MPESATIHSLIRFQNGMVMAFNANGEQIPDYQGTHKEVIERLKGVDVSI